MKCRILLVEDEENIVELLKLYLEDAGYEVKVASNGAESLRLFKEFKPDLILLDIMLPEKDGLDVCREVRKSSQVPIIMLTAKDTETDKVVGLELGADDYVTKPFSPRELMARIKAVLRRSSSPIQTEKITFGELTIDLKCCEVYLKSRRVDLTATEFEILKVLVVNPRQVFSRERLMEKVWGYDFYGGLRTIDVHIKHLREKLSDQAERPRYIETVRGMGYRFIGEKNV
jgi:DNA-binding response OmpR family regulator